MLEVRVPIKREYCRRTSYVRILYRLGDERKGQVNDDTAFAPVRATGVDTLEANLRCRTGQRLTTARNPATNAEMERVSRETFVVRVVIKKKKHYWCDVTSTKMRTISSAAVEATTDLQDDGVRAFVRIKTCNNEWCSRGPKI